MIKAIPFFASFLTAVSMLVGVWLGGVFTFLTPVVVFMVIPLADAFAGYDTEDVMPDGAVSPMLDSVVRLWVPTLFLVLGVALSVVVFGNPTPLETVGILVSTALVSAGGGINAAHELMHRKAKLDRGLAEVLMTATSYTHFCIEHVHGHHKNVATPLDPATSRLGESLYAYLPRTLAGGLRSAIRIELGRNSRRGVGWFTWRNRLTRYAVVGALSWLAVYAVFGWVGLLFHVAQGWMAATLLEVINYVEHYGLQRVEVRPGVYEKVQPRHSWNTNHRVSNWWLFNLQRHADHHAHASRPYYNLRAFEDVPQLPFGYPTAILAALVPPLWWAIMDHRVAAQQDQQAVAAK